MTDATNPVETSLNMQSRSLPTRWCTSTRCYVTSSSIGKSVHLLLRHTTYINCTQLPHVSQVMPSVNDEWK